MIKNKILFLGDRVKDEYILPMQARDGFSDKNNAELENRQRWAIFRKPGGAGMAYEMLKTRFSDHVTVTPVLSTKLGKEPVKSLAFLQECVEDKNSGRTVLELAREIDPKTVLSARVSREIGYRWSDIKQKNPPALPDDTFDIVALTDAGTEISNEAILSNESLQAAVSNTKEIVLKTHVLKTEGRVWDAVCEACKNNKVLVTILIHVEDARLRGARIARGLSWDKVVEDVRDAANDANSIIGRLAAGCDRLVIFHGSEGAVILSRQDRQAQHELSLVVHANEIEGDLDKKADGRVFGLFNCFFAGILGRLGENTDFNTIVAAGLADTYAYEAGSYRIEKGKLKYPDIPKPTKPASSAPDGDPNSEVRANTHPYLVIKNLPKQRSVNLVAHTLSRGAEGVARDIVLYGPEKALGQAQIPYGVFGDLITISRSEIEALRAIDRLFARYRADTSKSEPISIAVFGPPGSGKSFGVKQLVDKTVNPILEFNLSEISANDLPGFFHLIRDENLKGKTPLCFFDEFDAHDLSLLASFLAPMQDGKFREGQEVHPVGRGLFVFAGGTADTMEQFSKDLTSNAASMAKKPDFVSRLSGFINVRGPNRFNDADDAYILRRAILVRFQLQKRFKSAVDSKGKLTIQDDLLDQLLFRNREYRHGARSIETYVRLMGAHPQSPAIGMSDLPPEDQADLHLG